MRIEPHFWPAVECSGFEQKLFDMQLAIILGCHEQLTVCRFGVKQVHGHCSCNLEQLVPGTHTFCCNTACMRTLGSIFSSVSRMQVLYATFADNQLAGSIPVMSNITLGLNMSSNRFSTVSFEAFANSLQLLYLANNSLNGTLASTLPANLSLLNVSYNDFSGPLPSHLPPGMSVLNVSHNAFNRSLPKGWGKIQSLAQLNLDNNKFSGALPAEWSALGNNTNNSLQMSILDANLQGHMPRQWVQQFCLAIIRSSQPQVLFEPINITFGIPEVLPLQVGPLLQLPAQHASINVSLGSKVYNFDYSSPASLCSIPNAGRYAELVWGSSSHCCW